VEEHGCDYTRCAWVRKGLFGVEGVADLCGGEASEEKLTVMVVDLEEVEATGERRGGIGGGDELLRDNEAEVVKGEERSGAEVGEEVGGGVRIGDGE